jgi:hypothetical protein
MTRHGLLALSLVLCLAALIGAAGFLCGRVTRADDQQCTTDTECAEMYGGYGDPEPVDVLI